MDDRAKLVRRGVFLSTFTVTWNIVEGVIAVVSGVAAGSIALLGFGIDSFIESTSGFVVGWRFSYEMTGRAQEETEKAELWAARITGSLLLLLALYLVVDSCRRLFGLGREPDPSRIGIALTIISLIIMPILAKAKLKLAGQLGSKALRADAYETVACAWLSVTTLAGLILNAALGWWWADPVAALVLVPLIVREGLEGLRGDDDD
ncbi:MAG: cation transporter [Acidobacteriota bacterium]|jgi:divalent metal cation (Fe/Co/Zn/Cd) transporter